MTYIPKKSFTKTFPNKSRPSPKKPISPKLLIQARKELYRTRFQARGVSYKYFLKKELMKKLFDKYHKKVDKSYRAIYKQEVVGKDLIALVNIIKMQNKKGVPKTVVVKRISNRFKVHKVSFGPVSFNVVYDSTIGMIREFVR